MPVRLNSSGGGSVTLDVPSTASTFNAVIPANNGTLVTTGSTAAVTQGMLASGVAGNGPAFSAYNSGTQSGLSLGVYNKVNFNVEEFDTANCYNPSLARFTPNVAGYYQVNLAAQAGGSTNTNFVIARLYKNGSGVASGFGSGINGSGIVYGNALSSGSFLVSMNGTTDYLEVYIYADGSGTASIASGTGSFSAFLARTA